MGLSLFVIAVCRVLTFLLALGRRSDLLSAAWNQNSAPLALARHLRNIALDHVFVRIMM